MSNKKIDEMLKKRLLDNVHDKAIEKYICENIYQKEALTASIKLIQNLRAEIERLNANIDVMVKEHERLINNTKSEAIKDFAHALKSKSELVAPSVYAKPERAVFIDDINNLVKQMTGGEDNE